MNAKNQIMNQIQFNAAAAKKSNTLQSKIEIALKQNLFKKLFTFTTKYDIINL
jgi:hypothetical protein